MKLLSIIEDARQLDHSNGNTLWMDALTDEMNTVRSAFEVF